MLKFFNNKNNDKTNYSDVINKMMQASMRPVSENDIIDSIVYEVSSVLKLDRLAIVEPTYDETLWHIVHEYNRDEMSKVFSERWLTFSGNKAYSYSVFFPLMCYEEKKDCELSAFSSHFEKAGIKSAIMCFIQGIDKKDIGYIYIFGSAKKRIWTKQEKQFSETISKFLSLNLFRFKANREKALQTVVFNASNIFSLNTSLDKALEKALKSISNAVKGNFIALSLLNKKNPNLLCSSVNYYCTDPVVRANFERYIDTLDFKEINRISYNKGYFTEEIALKSIDKFEILKNSSITFFPVIVKSQIEGYFIIAHLELKLWSKNELNILSMFTQMVSFSLENIFTLNLLKENQKINSSILNSSDDMIIMIDFKGNIKAYNDAFLNKVHEKTDVKEPLGKNIYNVWKNLYVLGIDEQIKAIYNSKSTIEREFESSSGNFYKIKIKNLFDDDNKPYAFTIFVQNISKEKKLEDSVNQALEQAKKASMAKSEFLASMSHEILTPLNAIIGYAYLLKNNSLNSEQSEYINNIEGAAKNLLAIINEILDFSKIESGKVKSFKSNIKIRELLSDIKTVLYHQAINKGLDFIISIDEAVPDTLLLDGKNLFHVITNLASNAVKYTQKGSVCVEVVYRECVLYICVKDTGIGISEEYLDKIFTRFQRGVNSDTDNIPGTGLGLSIAKELVLQMDGKIDVKSKVNEGSLFTVSIPVESCEIQENFNKTDMNCSSFKILVVDDNEINLSICKNILIKIGFNVVTVKSGFEAIKICLKDKFDCILMDHMMPKLDGIETTKLLRKRGINSPIIALTANTVDEYKDIYLKSGMNDMVEKPISVEKLERTIKKYLNY